MNERRRVSGNNEVDYSKQYFTIVCDYQGNGSYMNVGLDSTSNDYVKTIQFSTDNGKTWSEVTANSGLASSSMCQMHSGDRLLIKASDGSWGNSTSIYNSFNTTPNTARYHVEGNIMSLLYGDDFYDKTEVGAYAFFKLLGYSGGITSAENLVLPATTVGVAAYQGMFYLCNNLINAPKILPATVIGTNAYNQMFLECTSLITAPILPEVNIPTSSSFASGMFGYCTNLNYIVCLYTGTYLNRSFERSRWMEGVASSGTFVKNSNATNWPIGVGGIPSGWTVVDYS